MWFRKRLDISYLDLAYALGACCSLGQREECVLELENQWSGDEGVLCLSVRSAFDLLFQALKYPPGTEVLVSALTIPDMLRIVEAHNLVPVPVDVQHDTLAIDEESLSRAISSNTRAFLCAHLFGTRSDLKSVHQILKPHNILLIEDCAQAFDGSAYRGSEYADVSMFSFGIIKSATALGGALCSVKDATLRARIKELQTEYPLQTRGAYAKRVLGYSFLKFLTTYPILRALRWCLGFLGKDYDDVLAKVGRGFPQADLFAGLRKQASLPLVHLIARRISHYSGKDREESWNNAHVLRDAIENQSLCPGHAAPKNFYWVFPLVARDRMEHIADIRALSLDANAGGSIVAVPDSKDRKAPTAKRIADGLIYVPIEGKIPRPTLLRCADYINTEMGVT